MKLYFYILENNKIAFSEFEAKERAKSYLLEGKVRGFYNRMVLKSEIGLTDKSEWKQTVILDKRDDELAKKCFCDYFNGKMEEKRKEIGELQEKIKLVNDWHTD